MTYAVEESGPFITTAALWLTALQLYKDLRAFLLSCKNGNSPGANFCYACGGTLTAVAGGNPMQGTNLAPSTSGTTYVLISIPFAVVALFLFPPLFGGIGIFFGYKAMQAGNEGGGIAMMVVNGACLLFGMLSGMMVWGF